MEKNVIWSGVAGLMEGERVRLEGVRGSDMWAQRAIALLNAIEDVVMGMSPKDERGVFDFSSLLGFEKAALGSGSRLAEDWLAALPGYGTNMMAAEAMHGYASMMLAEDFQERLSVEMRLAAATMEGMEISASTRDGGGSSGARVL